MVMNKITMMTFMICFLNTISNRHIFHNRIIDLFTYIYCGIIGIRVTISDYTNTIFN